MASLVSMRVQLWFGMSCVYDKGLLKLTATCISPSYPFQTRLDLKICVDWQVTFLLLVENNLEELTSEPSFV